MIRPPAPTAQTSLGPLPHTAFSVCALVLSRTNVQLAPSKWRIVSYSPTNHASEGPVPQTARQAVEPLVALVQVLPFQWRITPPPVDEPPPTAQTSSGPLPQTP